MKAPDAEHQVKAWSYRDILLESYRYAPGPAGTLPRHSHEHYQFCLSLDFPGEYRYRGSSYGVPVGSLSIIHPGEMHSARDSEDRRKTANYRLMYVRPNLLRDAASELERGSRLMSVFTQLVQRHADTRPSSRLPARAPGAVDLVHEYLHDNYAENVSLEELARRANLSPYHLNRIFSREVGLPPHRYQIAVRVGRARELLAKGTPITRVARETGFADHSHLIRTFKRLVQVPRVDTFRKTARTFKTPRSLSAILQGTQGNGGATCPKETDHREEILGLPENRRTTGGKGMSEPSGEGTHVALVTGANRGIGLEVARRLARRGYAVILGSRDPQKGERAAAKLAEEGLSVLPRQLDVSDNKSVEDLVARIVDDPGHLGVLVNNAAIHYDTWQRALGADLDIVREALKTNTFGAWRTCEVFVPLLRGSGHGRIVTVSSGAGSRAWVEARRPTTSPK